MFEKFLHSLAISLAFGTPVFYLFWSWGFCFKTAQDGHKVVYPWALSLGALRAGGGGYVIASEQQYKLLRRHLKVNAVVWLVLAGIASYIQFYLGPHPDFVDLLPILIVVLSFIAFDVIWKQYLVRGMQHSEVLREAVRTLAREKSEALSASAQARSQKGTARLLPAARDKNLPLRSPPRPPFPGGDGPSRQRACGSCGLTIDLAGEQMIAVINKVQEALSRGGTGCDDCQ
jgi:hypothetical protein